MSWLLAAPPERCPARRASLMEPSMASVPLFEKNARCKPERAAEFLRETSLIFVVVKIRQVNGAGRLFAYRLDDSRMGMAESIHSQASDEVEIFLAIEVEEEDSLAALEDKRVAVIGLQQELFFALDNFFGRSHGNHDSTGIRMARSKSGQPRGLASLIATPIGVSSLSHHALLQKWFGTNSRSPFGTGICQPMSAELWRNFVNHAVTSASAVHGGAVDVAGTVFGQTSAGVPSVICAGKTMQHGILSGGGDFVKDSATKATG